MAKKSALGKGMDGLLPTGFDVAAVAEPGERITQVSVADIIPNVDQPRKEFDEASLKELSASIKEHGVIQPLIVDIKNEQGKHEIIAGERRWRASKMAGLSKVPVIVRDTQLQQKLEIAIIENVQRVDLSPLEEAMSMYRLRQEFGLSLDEIATKLGKAKPTVSNTMRLLQLTNEAKKALQEQKISEGHARAILSLTDEKMQNKLLSTIIVQNLSVREAEAEVKKIKSGNAKNPLSKKAITHIGPATRDAIVRAEKSLGSKVIYKPETSTLQVRVKDEDQLLDILKRL